MFMGIASGEVAGGFSTGSDVEGGCLQHRGVLDFREARACCLTGNTGLSSGRNQFNPTNPPSRKGHYAPSSWYSYTPLLNYSLMYCTDASRCNLVACNRFYIAGTYLCISRNLRADLGHPLCSSLQGDRLSPVKAFFASKPAAQDSSSAS